MKLQVLYEGFLVQNLRQLLDEVCHCLQKILWKLHCTNFLEPLL